MVGSHPKVFGVGSSGQRACEFAFLTSSQVMLMLLVQDLFQEPQQCESNAAQTLLSIRITWDHIKTQVLIQCILDEA